MYYRLVIPDKSNPSIESVETYFWNAKTSTKTLYEKGNYEKNHKIGKWEWGYANGQPKETGYYEKTPTFYEKKYALRSEGEDYIYLIESFWDSTGVQLVTKGNGEAAYFEKGLMSSRGNYLNGRKQGEWQGTFNQGRFRYTENYSEGKLTNGISYNEKGNSFTYDKIEVMPEIEGFVYYLMKTLRYPEKARRKGIEGKVFLQFTINTDGQVTGVEILKGIGGGCDEEAMRVVRAYDNWTPTIQRGQQVEAKMTLPVVFKLGR